LYEKELISINRANRLRNRTIFEENLVDLASNDYLGLSAKKTIFKKTYKRVLKNHYFSPKASMLVNGYSKIHKKFEQKLCLVNGFENAIVVRSGFLANISMIEALLRKDDRLFIDQEYHASGILASKTIINFLQNRAKPIIYSNALSLFDTALVYENLKYIQKNKEKLTIIKSYLGISSKSLIIPILVNDNKKVLQMQKSLKEKGFLVGAIRQSTVKSAIIRLIAKIDISNSNLYTSMQINKGT